MTLPLRIFEPRYLQMIDECVQGDQQFGVVLIKEGDEVGQVAIPHTVGTSARILGLERDEDGLLHITTVGEERFHVHRVLSHKPYLVGIVEPFPLAATDAPELGTLFDIQAALLSVYLDLLSRANAVDIRLQNAPDTPEAMAHLVAVLLQVPLVEKQRLLSMADLPSMLRREALLLRGEVAGLTVQIHGDDVLGEASSAVDLALN